MEHVYSTVKPHPFTPLGIVHKDGKPDAPQDVLLQCKTSQYHYSSTRWAAYQNVALDSARVGDLIFIAVGPENTIKCVTHQCAPDGSYGMGWRWYFVGFLNLETGNVEQ